ncbi:MAG TPA: CcmD family protein [Candidatus Polarisedimenticolia bacterium]|nr:CcmD family protein [Candidatus Polarisedimenticolia bacterium]
MTLFDPTGPLGAFLGALASGIQAAGAGAADAATAFAATAQPEAVERRLRFLSWAYTAVWLILAAYLYLLSMRQRRLERQARQLRDRIAPPAPTSRP